MNLHNDIRLKFGQESVKLVLDLEKTALKEARFKNHLRFNLNCKHQSQCNTGESEVEFMCERRSSQ